MGYVTNQNALSMRTGRSLTIGIMSSSISEEWGAKILCGALRAVQSTQYSLRVETVLGAEEERSALKRLLGSRIEGLFCFNINPPPETDEFFKLATERYRVAVVSNNCSFSFPHKRVEVDNSTAVMILMEHLVGLGHRQIAHIGGDRTSDSSRERSEAFLRGVESFNLKPDECPVRFSNWEVDQARTTARELLEFSEPPTAILCVNDAIAACVIQVANELNIKVPNELSVVGMTNDRMCQLTVPPLTTVGIPCEEVGYASIRALFELIESKRELATQEITRHQCVPVIRNSSAAARPLYEAIQ